MVFATNAFSYGFGNAICTQHLLEDWCRLIYDIHAFVDSKTLFNVVIKDGITMKKRLQIEITAIQDIFTNLELKNVNVIFMFSKQCTYSRRINKNIISKTHSIQQLMETIFWLPLNSQSSKDVQKILRGKSSKVKHNTQSNFI